MSTDDLKSGSSEVAGIRITRPERLIYPDERIRKIDLARYYASIAGWVVPHVAGRPLTLVYCPNGLASPCVYMRHKRAWGPHALRRVQIREKTKIGEYLVADDIAGVVALVQMGIVEIHTWNSTSDSIERPNRLVWDLDPGPDVPWKEVVRAARTVREAIGVLGLESWVKTTGGRGLHVVAPLVPKRDWAECLRFAHGVANAIVRAEPGLYTISFAKRGRESLILIDYLRNNRTNTSISAFSPRARPGGAVSIPVSWNELGARLLPASFTVETVPRRLGRLRADPWADYWRTKQRITDVALRAISRL